LPRISAPFLIPADEASAATRRKAAWRFAARRFADWALRLIWPRWRSPHRLIHQKSGAQRMSHVAHELHEEFPDKAAAIHKLKISNAHFARIADEYHTLNRSIHRMETNVEPADDATIEDLKKKRLTLKDEIATFLAGV
jgi:uncharacterized protein YdcH (DUF465 family)